MNGIDKEEFGTFVAKLRKEQGMTQKDLAAKVYISDKAVSKWERGLSMPDIALLIPLAQALGITVTELLKCQRMDQTSIESSCVEELVHRVITYSEETPSQRQKRRRTETIWYVAGLIIVVLEMLGLRVFGYSWEDLSLNLLIYEGLSLFFAGYFCFFAKDNLPKYYDEYKVDAYSDGIFQMNMPGIHFNNRNWPHIKRAAVRGLLILEIALPAIFFLCGLLLPEIVSYIFVFAGMPLFFVGLFGPMYAAARRHE